MSHFQLLIKVLYTHLEVYSIVKANGYSVDGVFKRLFDHIIHLELPVDKKSFILKTFGSIESDINKGAPDRIQLGAIIGCCRYAVDMGTVN